jgi:hypothetical protein
MRALQPQATGGATQACLWGYPPRYVSFPGKRFPFPVRAFPTKAEAEEWLDWLEANRFPAAEVVIQARKFAVRFWRPRGTGPEPAIPGGRPSGWTEPRP